MCILVGYLESVGGLIWGVRRAQLPETNHLSVLAEGLALYFNSALSTPQYEALSAQISAAAVHWLQSFMKLDVQTRGSFFSDEDTAREYVCRVALDTKFPDYAEEGYKALSIGQPVFYYTYSELASSFHTLGLPKSSFRFVESVDKLETLIEEDKENGNIPTMILAFVGSGVSENITELHQISKKHDIFMHVEG